MDRGYRERKRETIRRWHAEHPEKTAEYSRRYYERNRDAVLARARQRRDQSPEKVKASSRDWQQRNREHLTEWQRQYRAENPDVYERALQSNRESKRLARRLKSLGCRQSACVGPRQQSGERMRRSRGSSSSGTGR
ncbi:hypothetical protein AB1285_22705 [Microbacterium sp. NRRL B-14842]|uniref:hypothetical protein n=1 Tax=Microbacterium sp. NRRL B-14842 TaxID=3162881 RepID=UPI003D26A83B